MNILWFTWKDNKHPLAGGAEVVNEELAKRLVKDGHNVKLIVGGFKDGKSQEVIDSYEVIRLGGRISVYYKTWRYYKKNLQGWADLVIDEVNTMPFFAKFYVKEKNILFVHMLCRKIWFYQLPFPLSLAGFVIEPLYLRLLNDRRVITVSESTKRDLRRNGFKPKNIQIISEGINISTVKDLKTIKKYKLPTVLSHGAIRPMKRTLDQVKAFEIAKKTIPNLMMKISGESTGKYGQKVLRYIAKSTYATDIEYFGKTTQAKKIELMQKSHFILVTSVKEGWGLIVTEANSQGTPAIVYETDGLRDSVRNNKTGYICENSNLQGLAAKIEIALTDPNKYKNLCKNAWRFSKTNTFENSYKEFKKVLK